MRRALVVLGAVLVLAACASPAGEDVTTDEQTSTTLPDTGFETVCSAEHAETGERIYLPCTDTNCAGQGLSGIQCLDLPRAQVEAQCFETAGHWDCTTTSTTSYTGDGMPPCGPADDPDSGTCVSLPPDPADANGDGYITDQESLDYQSELGLCWREPDGSVTCSD